MVINNMSQKQSMITINWIGQEGKRGLTQLAIETMQKVAVKAEKPTLLSESEKLFEEYGRLIDRSKIFSLDDEMTLVKKYVRVRV